MSKNPNATQDYIELLDFSDKFINSQNFNDIKDIFIQFFRIFKWGDKFMSPEQLFEIDRKHTELYAKYTARLRTSMEYMGGVHDCW